MKTSQMDLGTELTAMLANLREVAAGRLVGDAYDLVEGIAYEVGCILAKGWLSVASGEDVAAEMHEFAGGDAEFINQAVFPAVVNALGGNWDAAEDAHAAEMSIPKHERRAVAAYDVRTISEGYADTVRDPS